MPSYIVNKNIFVLGLSKDNESKVVKVKRGSEPVELTAEQAKPFIKNKSIEKV